MHRPSGLAVQLSPFPLKPLVSYMFGRDGFSTPLRRFVSFTIFALYLGMVIDGVLHHEFWRDEIHALSIAREPSGFLGIFSAIKNGGHPALWFFLLRGGYALCNCQQVLPALGFATGTGAAFLFLRFAPFAMWIRLLFLFGLFPLYEYSVMCRNYGISMLLFFAVCLMWAKRFEYALILGTVLFLLANTNAHSAIAVVGLAGFLLVDAIVEWRAGRIAIGPVMRIACGAFVAFVGVGLCVWTVMPDETANFVRLPRLTVASLAQILGKALRHPAGILRLPPFGSNWSWAVYGVLYSAVTVSLLRIPHLAATFLGVLLAMSIFFQAVYSGYTRHLGIVFSFVLSVIWIAEISRDERGGQLGSRLTEWARKCVVLIILPIILLSHVILGVREFRVERQYEKSSNKAFGEFLREHKELKDAIVVPEPDYALESLSYYAPHPLFFPREQRIGRRVSFTRANKKELTLSELLAMGRELKRSLGRPVLFAVGHTITSSNRTQEISFAANRKVFRWSPEELNDFQQATREIAKFLSAAGDENYRVYLLN